VTHTPGPWETRQLTSSTRVYSTEFNNAEICSIQRSRFASGPTTARREADARLIAAAPEMLAALKEIEWMFDGQEDINNNGGPNDAMKALAAARRAIAKAEAVS
jgi:hypothetical protein